MSDKEANTETVGDLTLPKWDRRKTRKRPDLKRRGRLNLDKDVKDALEAKGLQPRWVNQDEMGRFQEAIDFMDYQPVLRKGAQIVREVGSGQRACLMATPKDFYADNQKRKAEFVLDPTKAGQGTRVNPATGEREIVNLDLGDGEYVPGKEGDKNARAAREDTSPLR